MKSYRQLEKEYKITLKALLYRKNKLGITKWDEEASKKLESDLIKNPPQKKVLRKTEEIKLQKNLADQSGLIKSLQERIKKLEEENKQLLNYKNLSLFKKLFKK